MVSLHRVSGIMSMKDCVDLHWYAVTTVLTKNEVIEQSDDLISSAKMNGINYYSKEIYNPCVCEVI